MTSTILIDFHIHSKYARSCSNRLDIENIFKYCFIKWIDIIWTWDFTHPKRLLEIEKYLESNWKWLLIPKKEYLFKWIDDIKEQLSPMVLQKIEKWIYPHFILQTEINSVFTRGEKKSRIHNLILIDSIPNAYSILNYLSNFGKVESDWRLAVNQDHKDTLIWLKTNFPQSVFIPAHIWTPYFGVLGSRFGFENMEIAYDSAVDLVDAIETGLSSDPVMNWINPQLDQYTIISNSDAHSLENFGREINEFEYIWTDENYIFDYKDIEKCLKIRKYTMKKINNIEKNYLKNLFKEKWNLVLKSTVEFYPQEWKYFWDWHAKCNFLTNPVDTIKRNGKCPYCGWKLVVWVFHRAYNLWETTRIQTVWYWNNDYLTQLQINKYSKQYGRPWFKYIVPLSDIISNVWKINKWTKKYQKYYNELIKEFGSEFYILLDLQKKLAQKYDERFAQALDKVRMWDIFIRSGYDWLFGIVDIFGEKKLYEIKPSWNIQDTLF